MITSQDQEINLKEVAPGRPRRRRVRPRPGFKARLSGRPPGRSSEPLRHAQTVTGLPNLNLNRSESAAGLGAPCRPAAPDRGGRGRGRLIRVGVGLNSTDDDFSPAGPGLPMPPGPGR
jgi:hypothetical protein